MSQRINQAWQELLGKDDRTSPAEYPEMCLITRDELAALMEPYRDAMIERSEEDWDKLEDALGTLWGLQPGHVLSEADVEGLRHMDTCHRNDEEAATDAYHRGWEDGLRKRGGDELVDLQKRVDDAIVAKSVEKAMHRLTQARMDDAFTAIRALLEVRPGNWDDDEDPEQVAAWKLAQATLGPPCFNHPDQPSVTNLDGDELCQECADAWVKGEGHAAAEREAEEAADVG